MSRKDQIVGVDSADERKWSQRAGVVGAGQRPLGWCETASTALDLLESTRMLADNPADGQLFNGKDQTSRPEQFGDINQKRQVIGGGFVSGIVETNRAETGRPFVAQANNISQTNSTLNGPINLETIRGAIDVKVSRHTEGCCLINEDGIEGPRRAIKGSISVENYQRALNNLSVIVPKCVQTTRTIQEDKHNLIGRQQSKRRYKKEQRSLLASVSFQSGLQLNNEIHLLANNERHDCVRRDDILEGTKVEEITLNQQEAINSSILPLSQQTNNNNSSHQDRKQHSMSSNVRNKRPASEMATSGSGATQMASSKARNYSKSLVDERLKRHLEENQEIETGSQQKQRQHKFSSTRLDERRSTYCSSVGLTTDLNYDSSISSVANCSDLNQTNCPIMQPVPPVRGSDRPKVRASGKQATSGGDDDDDDQGQDKRKKNDEQFSIIINKTSKTIGDNNGKKRPAGLKKRDNWDKNIEFLLAVIGFAVDLGNVWRFPYICYKNGGGAFLIPYTVMFILGGLPIFYLEMSLGQYFSSGCLTVWRRVCPMAKGIGYAMCVLNFFTGLYYNTIISWAVFFFVESFTFKLPWTTCNNRWNSNDCKTIEQRQESRLQQQSATSGAQYNVLAAVGANNQSSSVHFSSPTKDYFEREVLQVHLSSGIDDLGSIRKPLAIYLAIVFVCIYFAIWKGVKSTGKAVWITALLPYFVLIPLLFRGVFLEGAWLGIEYYLYPDWAKIMDVDVWVEAAKQIYFSLGPGFGTLMALSSYNKFNHNCRRDALIAASVNYFASFISGLVIFAVLGYMATIENVSVEEVAAEGPGLVFQVYPEGLATMSFSAMWSVLFFMMVITLGIDSTFGGLESVITGLCDEYPRVLRAHRGIFIGLLIILIYLCSLPTTTYGGNFVIYLLESYGTSLSLLFIVLIETIIVCWLYGADKFCKNLEEMYGEMPGAYWRICWKYISPTILLLIFIAACGQELDKYHTLTNGAYTYPGWAPTVGLLMTGSSVCCVPIYAIYYVKTKTVGSSLWERLKIATRPIENDQMMLDEKDRYADALMDKIRDHNDIHLDTDI